MHVRVLQVHDVILQVHDVILQVHAIVLQVHLRLLRVIVRVMQFKATPVLVIIANIVQAYTNNLSCLVTMTLQYF